MEHRVCGHGRCYCGLKREVYGESPNVWVCRPVRGCRKFPSDSVGELALQGVWQPVYRFEDHVCDRKGWPNTIEIPNPMYAYHETRCELENEKVHKREAVLRYCRKHPEVAVNIGGPVARVTSRDMSIHLVKQQGPIYSNCTPGEGECMRVSIANAVVVLLGPEFVTEREKKMRQRVTVCDSLKPIGTLVNQLRVGLEVHKLGKVAI